MAQREVGTLVFLGAGLVILAVVVWARRGRSYRARSWMYTPLGDMRTERIAILGGPICGLGLLACGAIALPPQAFGLTFIGREVTAITTAAGMAMFGLLALPLLYWVLIFIPLPDALYPRWAREVREDRRQFPQTNPSQPSHPRDQPDSEWR